MARSSAIVLSILGRRLRARGAGCSLERWIRRQWEFPDPLANARAGDIDLEVNTEPPPTAPATDGEPWLTRLDGVTLSWERIGDRSWRITLPRGGVQLTLDENGGRIRAWGMQVASDAGDERDVFDGARGTDGRFRGSVPAALHVAICEALRATGLVPLHGAIIVRDGHATALVGPSGAGKSTTLIRALDSGWLPLAEDFAWLDPVTRQVYGWDRAVRLTEEGLDSLPSSWRSAGWRTGADGKRFLPFECCARVRPASAELMRLAVLHRDPRRRDSAWEPMAPHDAVRALWESAGVPLCQLNRADFSRQAPLLLDQLDVARLVLGRGSIACLRQFWTVTPSSRPGSGRLPYM
ncbi:MAG: hypothetical protein ACREM1_17110 [Longimicrobiales bacterium]